MQRSLPLGSAEWPCLLRAVGSLWLLTACCRSLADGRGTFHSPWAQNRGRTSPWGCTSGPVTTARVQEDKHRKVRVELGERDDCICRGMVEVEMGDWVGLVVLVEGVCCALEGSDSRPVGCFDSANRFGKRHVWFFRGA